MYVFSYLMSYYTESTLRACKVSGKVTPLTLKCRKTFNENRSGRTYIALTALDTEITIVTNRQIRHLYVIYEILNFHIRYVKLIFI